MKVLPANTVAFIKFLNLLMLHGSFQTWQMPHHILLFILLFHLFLFTRNLGSMYLFCLFPVNVILCF
jgi:hypothetical protein